MKSKAAQPCHTEGHKLISQLSVVDLKLWILLLLLFSWSALKQHVECKMQNSLKKKLQSQSECMFFPFQNASKAETSYSDTRSKMAIYGTG